MTQLLGSHDRRRRITTLTAAVAVVGALATACSSSHAADSASPPAPSTSAVASSTSASAPPSSTDSTTAASSTAASVGALTFSGSGSIVDSDGYSFHLSYDISAGKPSKDVMNSAPGDAVLHMPLSGSFTVVNSAADRNAPTNNVGRLNVLFLYPLASPACTVLNLGALQIGPNSGFLGDLKPTKYCAVPTAWNTTDLPATLGPGGTMTLTLGADNNGVSTTDDGNLSLPIKDAQYNALAAALQTPALSLFVTNRNDSYRCLHAQQSLLPHRQLE
jgi:hypothetical protein